MADSGQRETSIFHDTPKTRSRTAIICLMRNLTAFFGFMMLVTGCLNGGKIQSEDGGRDGGPDAGPVGGIVATPTFLPPEGNYQFATTVAINCETEEAEIRYTLDGSDPSPDPTSPAGIPYTGPITVSETTTLKAIAYKPMLINSTIASSLYTISTVRTCGMKPYSWLPKSEMGTVVKYRQMRGITFDRESLAGIINALGFGFIVPEYGVDSFLYVYNTQDRGRKLAVTSMISFPRAVDTLHFPVVLWLHGAVGYCSKCAVSRGRDVIWEFIPAAMASLGFIVVAPDYIGMNGYTTDDSLPTPFMIGEPTAIASLDALKGIDDMIKRTAVRVIADNRVVLWGESQGGHAALFTDLFAPYYSPETNIVGTIASVPLADMIATTEDKIINFGTGSGIEYIATESASFSRWYGYQDRLNEVLSSGPPHNFVEIIPNLMDNECDINLDDYDVSKSSDIFTAAFIKNVVGGTWNIMNPWYCMYTENSINRTSLKYISTWPLLYILAEQDQMFPTYGGRAAFQQMCSNGYKAEYLECKGANHVSGGIWSMPEQITWIKDRLAGKPFSSPCVVKEPVCCKNSSRSVCIP